MTAGRPSLWLLWPVLTALALFALAHHDLAFASVCALLVVGAYGHRFTLPWPTLQRWPGLIGGLLTIWALCWAYYATVLQAGHGLLYFPRIYYKPVFITTSGMLLALALVCLWHLPHVTSRTNGCILMGATSLVIASGNFLALPSLYGPCLIVFMGTTLAALCAIGNGISGGLKYLRYLRVWPMLLLLGCALGVGVGTWAISTALPGLETMVSTAIIQMIQGGNSPDGIGVGNRLRIERHRRVALTRTMVLTLSGMAPPGYLRTHVMSQYRNGLWKSEPGLTLSASLGTVVSDSDGIHVELPSNAAPGFMESPTTTTTPPPTLQRTVTLLADLRGVVPLPYATRRMASSDPVTCTLGSGAMLRCIPPERLLSYHLTSDPVTTRQAYRLAVSSEDLGEVQQARQAPETVLAPLRALAQQVVGPFANVPLAAARLLQEYFRHHYTYALSVDLADHGDPVVDFVLHRRPAYCEYYAAGLTLMLRALGIPARVVGGFVVHEYNSLAGQWIVRQRDAHAWTEVFDATGNAWVAFDATPRASDTAQAVADGHTLLAQSWVWMTLQAQHFLAWMRTVEVQRWLDDLGALGSSLLQRPVSWLVLALGISLGLGITQRRWLLLCWNGCQRQPGGEPNEGHDPDGTAVEVQRLFGQVARALQDANLPIGAAETLEEYLQRVQDLQSNRGAQADAMTACSLEWHQALKQFAQIYTELRFRHPEVTDLEPDIAVQPLLSLALLRHQAEQVLTVLGGESPPCQR